MAEDQEQKPTRSKSTPKTAPEPAVQDQALGDVVLAAISDVRQQLRRGESLALPGILQRVLPEDPNKGDRAKVIDWRAWVVWAEWTGSEWDMIVYQDGKQKS